MLICLCCVVFVGRGGVPSCSPQQQQQQQEAMVANHCVLTKTSHPTFNPSSLSCCCSHTASVPHPLCPPCLANHPHTIIIHHAPHTHPSASPLNKRAPPINNQHPQPLPPPSPSCGACKYTEERTNGDKTQVAEVDFKDVAAKHVHKTWDDRLPRAG